MSLSHVFKHRSILSCFVLAIALIAGGCSKDEPGPTGNQNPAGHTAPNPGSIYTFDGYNVDSAGTKLQGTDKHVIWTVAQNGLTYKGKTGVVKMIGDSKIGYFYHSPNGDLIGTLDASNSVISGIWITYPFGSRTAFNYPAIDTVVPAQGGTARIQIFGTVTYIGEEDIVVGSETIKAQKILDRMTQITDQTGIPTTTLQLENTLWYSPKVGYFVKQYTVMNTLFGTFGIRSRTVGNLTSYSRQ